MTKRRFADEFKEEAVTQVIERRYTVADVAKRLGVSVQSLYGWYFCGYRNRLLHIQKVNDTRDPENSPSEKAVALGLPASGKGCPSGI